MPDEFLRLLSALRLATAKLARAIGTGRSLALNLAGLLASASVLAGDGIIHNDTLWRDTAGSEMWCNGGHILRESGRFWWVGYDTGPGRWPWRINLYSSTNLTDWTFERAVIRAEGKFADMGWAGRPGLLHCRATGKYVIIFEADSPRQWKRHKVGFATCDRVDGAYELVNTESPEGTRSTGDQSVYQEADRAYLLATMDKDIGGRKCLNQSLAVFELTDDFLSIRRKVFEGFDNVSGDTNRVPRDHSSREACHLVKVGEVYYWFSSGLVGWNSSATMYSTARDLAGPWSDLKLLRTDPRTPDSFNTQHDFVVPVAGSEVTSYVYIGDRYSQWTKRGPGRNIFLPLVWENGEPLLRWHKDWRIDVATGRFSPVAGPRQTDAGAAEVRVQDASEFRQAIAKAEPGARIFLAAGLYSGGFHFANLRGKTNNPIIIAAADPAHPPVFQGSAGGLHLSAPASVELHHLVISNMTGNGLNIDDGGSLDTPARHILLRGLKVSDIGPGGNRDGIKLSGVADFRVEDCVIERWGTGGGSGIDMVGCHRGVIQSNVFRHTDSVGSSGVQAKGGTSQIVIRRNRFENAGGRAVNIGGSTGLQFFRPPLKSGEPHCEAKAIHVEGNTFTGSSAPVAFVGVDGATVRFNTIYHPKRWALRILQETRAPDFVPSRNGEFTDNIVAFDSRTWAEGGVNIGAGTAPQTFKFARNWWHCLDDPARSRPRLPVDEADGIYGQSPQFRDASAGDLRLQPSSPARRVGAEAAPD